jgi:hypothetical protein
MTRGEAQRFAAGFVAAGMQHSYILLPQDMPADDRRMVLEEIREIEEWILERAKKPLSPRVEGATVR